MDDDDMTPGTHDTTRDGGRWTEEPGYMAPIESPIARIAHRAAVRSQGLRERRSESEEPSYHQMCSMLLDATALMLAEAESRGDPSIAKAFTAALRSSKRRAGWRMSDDLQARVGKRLTPDAEARADHLADMQGRRDQAVIDAARREARIQRSQRLRVERLRRHGLLDEDTFTWGDDEGGSARQ